MPRVKGQLPLSFSHHAMTFLGSRHQSQLDSYRHSDSTQFTRLMVPNWGNRRAHVVRAYASRCETCSESINLLFIYDAH